MLNQQSLHADAPTLTAQYSHHVSLLASRSESQRRDSLSFLTTFATSRPRDTALPQPTSAILPKVSPLILDGNGGVRTQALRLLRVLPEDDMRDHSTELLPYIRAGMTHLAADIRLSTMDVLSWLLQLAGQDVVSCAGGFTKTMVCFLSLLNWHGGASAAGQPKFSKAGTEGKPLTKVLQVLGEFLHYAVGHELSGEESNDKVGEGPYAYPLWHTNQHLPPSRPNAYSYLNLFGAIKDYEDAPLEERDDRVKLFNAKFRALVEAGVDQAKKEGGETGRIAASVAKVIREAKVTPND